MPCHSDFDVLPGDGPLEVEARRVDRHASVADVIDVPLHGADHDVLLHQLEHRQGLFHFGQVLGRRHAIKLLGDFDLVVIRDLEAIGLVAAPGDDRAVPRLVDLELSLDNLWSLFHSDDFGANRHVEPFAVVAILPLVGRIDFFHVTVGGIRAAGGHGDRAIAAVPERGDRQADDRHPGELDLAAV